VQGELESTETAQGAARVGVIRHAEPGASLLEELSRAMIVIALRAGSFFVGRSSGHSRRR